MNAEIFAEWLRRQQHRVLRTSSSYWFDAGPRTYQAFPYHWVIEPTERELEDVLRKNHAIGLRYSAPLDSPQGMISYHVMHPGPRYAIDMLDRRTRQNVRNGLSRCRVEAIAFDRLAEEGFLLEMDTAKRQGRGLKTSKESWRRRCLAAADLPGFAAWGALVENRLVASLLTCQVDDCCEMISQQCHHDYLNARVNNALIFTVTEVMMSRPAIHSVFYTVQSLDAPPSVDEFKFRMGFIPKKVRQRVVFHPLLAPMAGRAWHRAVQRLAGWFPGNASLPKLAGMLRFYLEGGRPLDEQGWPDCLMQSGSVAAPKH